MARLYLFAEGRTEEAFASGVLRPHLSSFGVYLNILLIGTSRHRGKIYRGGGRKYISMKEDIGRLLKQERGPDVSFTTMIDLYALFHDMPGREDAEAHRDDPYRRIPALEAAFAADIGDRRFLPYIQLHEFEAILFVDPSQFDSICENARRGIAELVAIVEGHRNPEWIDDGQHTAPSKRIIDRFPEYAKAK